jgi:hypothetical protein
VLRRIRKRAARQDLWFYRSVAITTSLTGLLVSGAFSDRLYAEAPFWMTALAIALNRLHLKALEASPAASVNAPLAAQTAATAAGRGWTGSAASARVRGATILAAEIR